MAYYSCSDSSDDEYISDYDIPINKIPPILPPRMVNENQFEPEFELPDPDIPDLDSDTELPGLVDSDSD